MYDDLVSRVSGFLDPFYQLLGDFGLRILAAACCVGARADSPERTAFVLMMLRSLSVPIS